MQYRNPNISSRPWYLSFSPQGILIPCLLISWVLCAPGREAQAAPALDRAKLHQMDAKITEAIEEEKVPGGVLWVEHGKSKYSKAFGNRALVPEEEVMTKDTIFDLASLTK